ncbi:MAG: Eco57I restriction-modification methylase domain-containing protein [Candidatus Entotheonellia bacterium]
MLDEMHVNDEQLQASDIRQLENADEIAHFFAKLRYDVDERTNIPDYAVLGMGSADMRQHIHKIELIGKDPVDGDISIYLFEVRSITAKLRNDIARRFRERPEKSLLILTQDYEELEFVLLERILSKGQSRRVALKQAIRPIPLAVKRLRPEPIALRVLKRFTFTEEDSDYQWEKLRSAYMLAEWSEEYFNNRALFSDYYLNKRLTDPKITPEWNEDVRPVGREIYNHIITARKNYTRQTEEGIRRGLYEPVFKLLGFDFATKKSSASAAAAADYLLYTPGDKSKPIAAALTYVWNRNLDDVDESREGTDDDGGKPFEIPGAKVVSLLEAQVAPWVIVTNGKLWRLYSSTASNKATNYYEIDLEEAIAANDQITALKYWWLMFRQQAFTGFLDKLLKDSAEYAKELGDRLKNRVFEEIFPQFAKGFIADMRAKGVSDLNEEALAAVFSGTMTFLYRLMFILYAESLELLPVHDVRGYREHSLDRMKYEIADAGGTLLDASPEKLSARYKTDPTALYERLQALFTVIDQGSDELNMPTYNGGLFSPETDSGRFLATYAIPDRYLALGLDRLTRDVDDRTKALVFIDFKSLGVRHLGSIYEGLLEFKLRIAAEKFAVTKEKGKEVYKPAKQVKKPLAIIDKGDVYLENDKRERKVTGSYYTPDYIVKYIVRHTVGPVLERKFAALEKRLRDAQRDYRKYVKLVEARRNAFGRDESATVYWNNRDMQNLVDDCMNVRVLDPAMGSGHFLVEVVDYVSNRLIDFLNAWSENPVWAFLEKTRDDILNEMERQKVTIDSDRLTRVSLLKRAVLKRCVYGVDLNAMGVELAKVSLWLDAFTLGAPLSFLDHHLKHGNSLIGARITNVQDYLRGGEGPEQIDMFSGSEFAGVMLATDLMRQVSYLSDNTIEQTRQSARAYHDARNYLAPYKRLLDVYTSRWFNNNRYATKKADSVRLFLKDSQTKTWLKALQITLDDTLFPATDIAQNALRDVEEKSFFHWELEFPEVFFAPSKRGGQDVQLRKDGGFDAAVGNPPYVDSETMVKIIPIERDYIASVYSTSTGNWDLYIPFVELSYTILNPQGNSALITPNKWMAIDYGSSLRRSISNKVYRIADYSHGRIFEDAGIFPIITCISAWVVPSSMSVVPSSMSIDVFDSDGNLTLSQKIDRHYLNDDRNWGLLFSNKFKIFQKIWDMTDSIASYLDAEAAFTVSEAYEVGDQLIDGKADDDRFRLVVTGCIDRYENLWGIYPTTYLKNKYNYPVIDRKPFEKYSKRRFEQSQSEKIIVSGIRHFEAILDEDGNYIAAKSTSILRHFTKNVSSKMVLALLNSHFTSFYLKELYGSLAMDAGITFTHNMISELPFPRLRFDSSIAERELLTRGATGAYDIGDSASVLQRLQVAIDSEKTDVVHDLLAHLAQCMIDLNKQKQGEVRRFLGWLEKRLKIQPKNDGSTGIDSLTGKTILQGYLGDYQKGEVETSWREFHYRLYQNRNRFAVSLSDVEGEIQHEYEKSLATLIPMKRDLARTDALIDKIVYRLYGLTDEEIELIERPQYEQALADAKAQVVADKAITDDEEKIEKIAEGILPAARRFFERVEPTSVEELLDSELPSWRSLPPDAPTFLLTGDYNLRTLPDHMDFSTSVIPYTKAVEVALSQLIFTPFRQQYTDADCTNDFLKKFMRREKDLTLGSFMIILSSSRETVLRNFISRMYPDAATRVFGAQGLVNILNDEEIRDIRNKAAHDEVLSRDEAQQTRSWAMQILGQA